MAKKVLARSANGPDGHDKLKKKWTLSQQVINETRSVFSRTSAKNHYLHTNNKTWVAIVDLKGVKKDKAREIAKNYVRFLRDVAEGAIEPDRSEFDARDAIDLYKKRYEKILEEKDYESLIREVPRAPT